MKISERIALALSFIALITSALTFVYSRRAVEQATFAIARSDNFSQEAAIRWPSFSRAIYDTVDGWVVVSDSISFEVTHTDTAPAVAILPYGFALAPKRVR